MNERNTWGYDPHKSYSWYDDIVSNRYQDQISRVYDECVPKPKKPTMPKVPKTKKESSWEDSDEAMLLIG